MVTSMNRKRIQPKPNQESVWDYPRPPRLEETGKHVRVVALGETIATSSRAKRVLETSHPPVYYIPCEDVRMDLVIPAAGQSWCEWKGTAQYFDMVKGDVRIAKAAWAYLNPTAAFESIRKHLAFYAHLMDGCYVDGEQVAPQAGQFYGGWITSDIVGPFKGEPGSAGW